MTFHEHLNTCERCREHPFDLCSAGLDLLNQDIGPISDKMAEKMTRSVEAGKRLAILWMELMPDDTPIPTVIHALASIFASMLVHGDRHTTLYEMMGHGLLGDEQRLAVFGLEVKDMARAIREARDARDMGQTEGVQ